jgi:hypothetical protein
VSNNAIYGGSRYRIVDVVGHEIELESVGGGPQTRISVDVVAPGLVLEPTDDEWALARQPGVTTPQRRTRARRAAPI